MTGSVLVVDDEAGIREFLSLALAEEGLYVTTAQNGREALDRIAADRPSLVLCDLQMPVMTGWDVLTQLQHDRANIPVVFMTASYGARAEAERQCVDGFLTKPFELSELLAVLASFLP